MTIDPAVEDKSLVATIGLAHQQIAAFFERDNWVEQVSLVFGKDFNPVLAKSYSEQLPNIEVIPASILGTANGAYAAETNTIYLPQNLLDRGDQQEILAVLIEEIGHGIDAHLHQQDAVGDEGEIFARLVTTGRIEESEYLVMVAEDDSNQILWQGRSLAVENNNFTIRAAGTVEIRGNSDLDGNPLDLQDDARIYAGQGFSFRGNTVLPVKRDINGNALRDSQGKLILVDRAGAVSSGYFLSEITGQNYGNINPPQIVATQPIDIPSYSTLEQQYLTSQVTSSVPQLNFNAATANINTAARWQQNFPVSGTNNQLKVVRVTGGDLNIPTGISLSNCIIIVENGDIDLRNGTQQFTNVTLVTKTGSVLLGNVQAKNLTVLSAKEIDTASGARFDGNTILTTKVGNIAFKGATTNLNSSQNLQVIAHGEIDYRSNLATRGQFLSTGDFVAVASTNIYGSISSIKCQGFSVSRQINVG
jgi:hypothetical protein